MFQATTDWIYDQPEFREQLRQAGIESLDQLSSPSLGEFVTGHRSSWVRRWTPGTTTYYIKTYDYPTRAAQSRGIGRNTWLAPSRVRREHAALRWLAAGGFATPQVRAVAEIRRCRFAAGGFLVRAVMVTEAWAGEALSSLLPALPAIRREGVLLDLEAFVGRLHALGFRDRNLDLRNILARPEGSTWQFAKIDSPRFRLVPPGPADDDLAREDRERLGDSLVEIGLVPPWTRPTGSRISTEDPALPLDPRGEPGHEGRESD